MWSHLLCPSSNQSISLKLLCSALPKSLNFTYLWDSMCEDQIRLCVWGLCFNFPGIPQKWKLLFSIISFQKISYCLRCMRNYDLPRDPHYMAFTGQDYLLLWLKWGGGKWKRQKQAERKTDRHKGTQRREKEMVYIKLTEQNWFAYILSVLIWVIFHIPIQISHFMCEWKEWKVIYLYAHEKEEICDLWQVSDLSGLHLNVQIPVSCFYSKILSQPGEASHQATNWKPDVWIMNQWCAVSIIHHDHPIWYSSKE